MAIGPELADDLKRYIRDVPDFPKPGILFRDITPMLASPSAFGRVVDLLAERYSGLDIDAIAAVEARGFFFAAPLALRLSKSIVPIRKPGKLPYNTITVEYDLEYGNDTLQMHIDGVESGQRVLLVDDVLATGGTMRAACDLVEKSGASVAGCAFVIELAGLEGRGKVLPHDVFSLIHYED